jgi:hypothetical protein
MVLQTGYILSDSFFLIIDLFTQDASAIFPKNTLSLEQRFYDKMPSGA